MADRVLTRQSVTERRPAEAINLARSTTSFQTAHSVQLLQRRLGNQGTHAFLARHGPSPDAPAPDMPVSHVSDPAEREATRVAAEVVRAPDPVTAGAAGSAGTTAPIGHNIARSIQRNATDSAPTRASGFSAQVNTAMSGGAPLPSDTRNYMEPRFGQDFGAVRIHTGEHAARLSDQVNASAFTVGKHIFFGTDQFRPQQTSGKELIAHELTHTIQQGSGTARVQREEKKSWWQSIVDFGESAGWKIVDTVAPGVGDILRKGVSGALDWMKERASSAFEAVVNTLMAPVRAISGIGQQLSALFAPMVTAIQTAAGQIARNDCTPLRDAADKIEKTAERIITPIIQKVQPVVAKVKSFFNTVWEKVGAPIWNWIKEYAAEQWAQIKWLGEQIGNIASWIWEKTAWIRSLAAKAWTWVKNKLGIGEGPDGQNGLLQWVEDKFAAVWATVQAKLAPFKTEITAIVTTVGAVLLALSPAGPILAVGAAVAGAVQGLRWIAANWGKGNLMVQARVYLEKTLIPPLLAAIGKLQHGVTAVANAISGALASVTAALARAAASLGGTLLNFAVTAVQWVADEAAALANWAHEELDQLAVWVATSIGRLQQFLVNMVHFFQRVGDVVLDVMGLPVLLAEKIWNWVPACIRDPIVDFIGPIVLQQIELFKELAKDNEAWQKTKADIGNLIKLVFKDHDLIGAMKAAFMLVLRVFNIPLDLLKTLIQKAMASWNIVSRKPLDFIKNTVRALGHGFKLLWGRIGYHLEFGLKGWLLGALGEAHLTPPASWTNPKDLFFFVLDVLGLSVDHLFDLLAKRFDPGKVAKVKAWYGKISSALAWINKTINVDKSPEENTKGLIAQAKDFGTTILTDLVTWVTVKVSEELAIMAASAAATAGLSEIIDIARRIYKALVTAQRWARRILDMANEALDMVLDIADGAIEKVGAQFELIMHRGMPVVIGFLADQVGLGGVGAEIASIVAKLREKVDAGILWLIDKVKAVLDAIIGGIKAGVAAIVEWWQQHAEFRGADGEDHKVYFDGAHQLVVESQRMRVGTFFDRALEQADADTAKKVETARDFYKTNIEPVEINGSKSPDLVQHFAENFTTLSRLLADIIGAGAVSLPAEAVWKPEAPLSSAVESLSKRTVKEGTRPDDTTKGWDVVMANGLTSSEYGSWVQMHMITAGVGGLGQRNNLLPAPNRVNTGSEVRGFELRLEALVKGTNTKTHAPNVVWANAEVGSFYRGKAGFYDDATFASSYRLAAGIMFQRAPGDWVKDPTPILNAAVEIPAPDLTGGAPDLNSDAIGQAAIAAATGVTEYFASIMILVRNTRKRGFADTADFRDRMESWRAKNQQTNPDQDSTFASHLSMIGTAVGHKKARFGSG